ncbi:unnamed protein product [Chrysoparadoxa australica]
MYELAEISFGHGPAHYGIFASLTSEQKAIVHTDLKPGDILTVMAFAGTGKTTSLKAYAQARPNLRFLYLSYNVAVKDQAALTFPKNVTCKGVNQLAYAASGYQYGRKLTAALREVDVADALNLKMGAAKAVVTAISNWHASAATELRLCHIPASAMPGDADAILENAKEAWELMRRRQGGLGMTHAGYVKIYQLSCPDLSDRYHVVMLDEAQDSNPAIADVVLRQEKCAKLLVGDSHQSIYGFIGAEDSIARPSNLGRVRRLTQCFRFGPEIAQVANVILRDYKEERHPLLGSLAAPGRVVGPPGDPLPDVGRPYAYLARTNATLIHAAHAALNAHMKVGFIGGLDTYNLEAFEDICHLAMGNKDLIQTALLRRFKDLDTFRRHVDNTDDVQWRSRIRMFDEGCMSSSEDDVLRGLRQIKRQAVKVEDASIILSNVHKAKGLEFDTVVLANDFTDLSFDDFDWVKETPTTMRQALEEVNLLYVALTRAKRVLYLNSNIQAYLTRKCAWEGAAVMQVWLPAPYMTVPYIMVSCRWRRAPSLLLTMAGLKTGEEECIKYSLIQLLMHETLLTFLFFDSLLGCC